MPDKPAAEVDVGEALVRKLLRLQAPGLADFELRLVAEGWDNSVWRLGEDHAVRLPRRAIAAPLVENEQRVLPEVAQRLKGVDVRVPAPVVAGRPGAGYPWAWSVVPWIDGEAGLRVPRALRTGWAPTLAQAVMAMHEPAALGFPANPYRGVPLSDRASAVAARRDALRDEHEGIDTLASTWQSALDAAEWEGPPLWIHGDLHPGNLVARGGTLTGIIDFGDVTAGDPAYDLAVAWLAFDAHGRDAFIGATRARYDAATWRRAHGWAVAVTLILLGNSDDNPEYLELGRECLRELRDWVAA
jgi:aminoglycoside phosphotransferase (APT) family kinase protein